MHSILFYSSEHSVSSGKINPSDIPRENKVVMVENACVDASLERRSDTGAGTWSESDLTSASNSKSASLIIYVQQMFSRRN